MPMLSAWAVAIIMTHMMWRLHKYGYEQGHACVHAALAEGIAAATV